MKNKDRVLIVFLTFGIVVLSTYISPEQQLLTFLLCMWVIKVVRYEN